MNQKKRKILVTSALPYANGALHIGHMLEYIQTDIWVRFQRLMGNEVVYVGADDAHGTPIMIKADQDNTTPEELIKAMQISHQADFEGFGISFDHYHSTHSEENRTLCELIYQRAEKSGYILKRTIKQAFDESKQLFLPDRLVRGTCPNCMSENQYGDNCENCGATYRPNDLINIRSALSDTRPTFKETEHLFFDLPALSEFLESWINVDVILQKEMKKKVLEWFTVGLKPWDISRDKPYFGFVIPNTNQEKYFYVWVDAPVGYMASFQKYCTLNHLDFNEWWCKDSTTELHHFIGKDIVYFHALFWPAMLHVADFRKPGTIHAHGFLTINGQKMSKSRGTFITAQRWLEHLDAEPLRYVFASRISARVEDIDLNLEEFEQKFNTDVVGKIVNIASRCSGLIKTHYHNKITSLDNAGDQLISLILNSTDRFETLYEKKEFSSVIRLICERADSVNQFINDHQPWKLAKQLKQSDEHKPLLGSVLSTSIQAFYCFVIILKPIMPTLAKKSERFLNCGELTWQTLQNRQLLAEDHQIGDFFTLSTRIEKQQIQALIHAENNRKIDE